MPLQLKSGAIFLHVPKTGGQWVHHVLQEQGLIARQFGYAHADLNRSVYLAGCEHLQPRIGRSLRRWIEDRLPRRAADRFLFCFVRHPLKWYESWYRYRRGKQHLPRTVLPWHPHASLKGTVTGDFNEFLANAVTRRPGFVSELYASFTTPGIRFIGRQENLVEDLIHVLRQLNETFDEDFVRTYRKVNESHVSKDVISWRPDLRLLLTRLELPALAHYGYLTPADRLALRIPPEATLEQSEHVSPIPLPIRGERTAA
jgi:hypothetical protein